MAYPAEHGYCSKLVLRVLLVMAVVLLLGYTVGPPSYWRLKQNSTSKAFCPCSCDCHSEIDLSLPLGLINASFTECGKHDPELSEEMEKNVLALLSEELALQTKVANETLEHTTALIRDAKRTSSNYQKEAEKCNVGVETCEEAREMAEKELIEERRLSLVWEKRARELGWKDDGKIDA